MKENRLDEGDEEESLFSEMQKGKASKNTKNEIQDMAINEKKPKSVFKKVKKITKIRKNLAEENF